MPWLLYGSCDHGWRCKCWPDQAARPNACSVTAATASRGMFWIVGAAYALCIASRGFMYHCDCTIVSLCEDFAFAHYQYWECVLLL